jgi:hypothetical protein
MGVFRIYEAGSPFNTVELPNIDYEQTADVLYLAHDNHKPNKLIRAGHASWSFNDVSFGPTIAAPTGVGGTATTPNTDSANSGNAYFPQPATYVVTAFNEDTGQESRASSSVTLTNDVSLKRNYNTVTWSAVTGATNYRIYKAENSQLYGYIGTTDVLTFRDDNIGPDLSQGPPIGDNPFANSGDYPATITFHEQRAIWGRTTNRPNGIWFSKSADFENMDFSRPSREDDSFAIGLVANKVNAVNQLVSSQQGLVALTSHNIFVVQGSNEDYIAASPPPRVRPAIKRGASRLNPVDVDNVIFYETAKTGEIRTIGYSFEIDSIKSDDLTIFSRHLFEGQEIVDWAYAEKPASAIWVVRGDGKMAVPDLGPGAGSVGLDNLRNRRAVQAGLLASPSRARTGFIHRRADHQRRSKTMSSAWRRNCGKTEGRLLSRLRQTFTNEVRSRLSTGSSILRGRRSSRGSTGRDQRQCGAASGCKTASHSPRLGRNDHHRRTAVYSVARDLAARRSGGGGWTVARPQQAAKVILQVVDSPQHHAGPDEEQLFEIKQRELRITATRSPLHGQHGNPDGGTSQKETVVIVKSDARRRSTSRRC